MTYPQTLVDSSSRPPPGPIDSGLEALLQAVESELGDLGEALRRRDMGAIEDHAQALHRALEQAVDGFSRAARGGSGIPPALRTRLVHAGGQVAAQRESLARATVALDRAMDVLMPSSAGVLPGPIGMQGIAAYQR